MKADLSSFTNSWISIFMSFGDPLKLVERENYICRDRIELKALDYCLGLLRKHTKWQL